ncbi:aldose epimerase family protein [Pseudomonas sp. dw_358]|uniref:aldose epimerase family protein n=1 Tax=Pseudomonas sp. dw_358 TaxID=2720083 RepID=UPI001BD6DC11|nr:aldose epimerase family protein [Pseudomonas sp. dw_358]
MRNLSLLTGLGISLLMSGVAAHAAGLTQQRSDFGKLTDGTPIEKYTLSNSHGMHVSVITYGAVLQSVIVPDKHGKADDVLLGFDDPQSYQKNADPHFGATIGRYGNRIANGTFSLDGQVYKIPLNAGPNAMHGGPKGFDTHVWKATPTQSKGSVGVTLSYVSPDGEMGFPGTLKTEVTYSLNERNELRIHYHATTDKPTVLNLTNHGYYNLAGAGNGTVLDQVATLHASHYTPVSAKLIPTGELAAVAGTPMDFLKPTVIGTHIKDDNQQLKYAEPAKGGFDFNYVLDTKGDLSKTAVEISDPVSGRHLQLFTTQPAVQLYTSNSLDGTITGKGGKVYQHWGAVALEAEHFPDSPNQPAFPTTRLNPGQVYAQTTVLKFSHD